MVRIDFYESGIGETTVITFPGGGIGIVDAHPSPFTRRPRIQEITQGRRIHFVCLTHPHADHGVDLVTVLQLHPHVEEFWHTVPDVPKMFYGLQEFQNFPSPFQEVIRHMRQGMANTFFDMFGAVAERDIAEKQVRSDLRSFVIDGVEITFLNPSEAVRKKFTRAYELRMSGQKKNLGDFNLLSGVLAIKYGKSVIVLGGDALKESWQHAVGVFRKSKLPKAGLLKIPHHGAANALRIHPKRKEVSYLDLCSRSPIAFAVLFAGDSKHPDRTVFDKLRERTNLHCLSNGLKNTARRRNPLNINIPGARAIVPAEVCNDILSFVVDSDGSVRVLTGKDCDNC